MHLNSSALSAKKARFGPEQIIRYSDKRVQRIVAPPEGETPLLKEDCACFLILLYSWPLHQP